MLIEDDDDRAAFFDSDEFAEPVTWTHDATSLDVTGIFSAPKMVIEAGSTAGVVLAEASFVCPSVALPADAAAGDILVRGAETWLVIALLPDGTGVSRALLERADS
jgi:hypothetical protein